MDKVTIGFDESIAAIRLNGEWRFYHDVDYMFILDIMKYDYPDGEVPEPGDLRFETLQVTHDNATQWMNSLNGMLTVEQVPRTHRDGTQAPRRLNYVIDFDERIWVGQGWDNDQTCLADFQPSEWVAKEDDPYKYLPVSIREKIMI